MVLEFLPTEQWDNNCVSLHLLNWLWQGYETNTICMGACIFGQKTGGVILCMRPGGNNGIKNVSGEDVMGFVTLLRSPSGRPLENGLKPHFSRKDGGGPEVGEVFLWEVWDELWHRLEERPSSPHLTESRFNDLRSKGSSEWSWLPTLDTGRKVIKMP